MPDVCIKCVILGLGGIFGGIMHDLGVNVGFSKRKFMTFWLNGGFSKRRCVILVYM